MRGVVRLAAVLEPLACYSTVLAYAEFVTRRSWGVLSRPEEIASLAVYLASHESSFTTAQNPHC
jgi:NAD(P)-dependent dehydrogenase (short-subunit alcohol dehydrogenase family)